MYGIVNDISLHTEIISAVQRNNSSMVHEENDEEEVSDKDLVASMTKAVQFIEKANETFKRQNLSI